MSNDRAQELTAKNSTNPSPHYALRPTPRSSQKPISAWLSTVSRFYRYSFGNCLLIWSPSARASALPVFNT